jgi:hypothetical protein
LNVGAPTCHGLDDKKLAATSEDGAKTLSKIEESNIGDQLKATKNR